MRKEIKNIIASSAILALVLSASPVWAGYFNDDEERLPRHAREIRKGVYDLGVTVDPLTGKPVRGRAYVHKAQHNGTTTAASSDCYGYIEGGIRWTAKEDFVFNAYNRSGLNRTALNNVFNAALGKWEDAADGVVGDGNAVEHIVGTSALTSARLRADYGSPDERNEVYFGRLSGGTIAVTVIWHTLGGQIVETDQVYNDRYPWSLSGETTKMDFDNIATHEHGHIMGMDDVYDSRCSHVTMYGYAGLGETTKRTLEEPDIKGVNELYQDKKLVI